MRLLISGVVFLFLIRLDESAIWSTPINVTGDKNALAWQPSSFLLQISTSKPKIIKGNQLIRGPVTSKPKVIKGNQPIRGPIISKPKSFKGNEPFRESVTSKSKINTKGIIEPIRQQSSSASSRQVISKIKNIKGNEPIESVFDDISEILPEPRVPLPVFPIFPTEVVHVHIQQQQETIQTFCNPAAPPECVDKTFGFCIDDIEYPEEDIKVAIELSQLAQKFTYKLINDAIRLQLEFENRDSECPYKSLVIKPIRARNIDGQWRVIVQNAEDILQRERIVICYNLDDYCETPGHFSPVHCYTSRCSQQYLVRKLLAYDPCNSDRGVFVDSFKLQSACSCRYSRKPC